MLRNYIKMYENISQRYYTLRKTRNQEVHITDKTISAFSATKF